MDRIDRQLRGAVTARRGIAATIALVLALAHASAAAAQPLFGPAGAAVIPNERLFDLGVADPDGDGNLDLFTANHKYHSALLRNDGTGNFTDVTGSSGFSPSPEFPGYENLRQPVMDRTGVYVYATDPKQEKLPGLIHLRSIGVQTQGSLSFGADAAEVQRADGVRVEQDRTPAGQPIIYFNLQPGAVLDIRTTHIDLPISVSIDNPPPPGSLPIPILPPAPPPTPPAVFVGGDAVPAPLKFILNLRDRHGYAFADLAGDGAADIFAVSGGLGGAIKLPGYVTQVQDELLVEGGGRLVNMSAGSGLLKGGCRARQTAAVDVDDDGQLDLFESCEGDPPKIFRQKSRGEFADFPSPESVATTYRWADLGRGRMDLLAAEERGTRVWTLAKNGWRIEQTIPVNAHKGQVAQYALNDYDNDGDLDVLAVSRSGNTLLRNTNGRLREVPLRRTGIPKRSVAASFVDYDNDGRIDLDLIPQGLLEGVGKGRFRKTGRLGTPPAGAGITSWFDYDNDGLRDPVMVTGNAEFAKRMKVLRAHNLGPGGHWLEVDLQGHGGNREAIGASVSVLSGNRRLYGWVGQSDDSHHSQGHYRLYFGLGNHVQAGGMVVHWPDGQTTRFDAFPADQVIDITQP